MLSDRRAPVPKCTLNRHPVAGSRDQPRGEEVPQLIGTVHSGAARRCAPGASNNGISGETPVLDEDVDPNDCHTQIRGRLLS